MKRLIDFIADVLSLLWLLWTLCGARGRDEYRRELG